MRSLVCAILVTSGIPVPSTGILDSQADQPALVASSSGYGKVTLEITAGPKGAPDGFTVLWMEEGDFLANGSRWYGTPSPVQGEATFTGSPVFNTWGATSYRLGPGQKASVEIGDLLDDTGFVTNRSDELTPGTRYVFTAFALGSARVRPSDPTAVQLRETRLETCAYTRQNWERNPQNWPVSTLTLGYQDYTKTQLLAILDYPRTQNGLVVLARQLIAAKLNIANGSDPAPVQAEITQADFLIGFLVVPPVGGDTLPPSVVRDLVQKLEDFNNGMFSSDPCLPTSLETSSWSSLKARYR